MGNGMRYISSVFGSRSGYGVFIYIYIYIYIILFPFYLVCLLIAIVIFYLFLLFNEIVAGFALSFFRVRGGA